MKAAEAASKVIALLQNKDAWGLALDKSICVILCFSGMIGLTLCVLWFVIRNRISYSADEQIELKD